jgi:hypothetical protein
MIVDTECAMPADVQQRHHDLNLSARACYGMRNTEEAAGHLERAQDYREFGDIYLLRALALTAEWEG